MSPRRTQLILSAACALGLVALGLIVWSLFDPRPIPVVGAMSVGQVIGTLSLAAFGFVVLADLRPRLGGRIVPDDAPPEQKEPPKDPP